MKNRRGFTLLEVLVATTIMGVAVVGLMSSLSTSVRNSTRLTDYDRAVLVARSRMDSLLVEPVLPQLTMLEGPIEGVFPGGAKSGWRARVTPFEAPPGAGPGATALERIELEIWWMDGDRRRTFLLDGYRRGKVGA